MGVIFKAFITGICIAAIIVGVITLAHAQPSMQTSRPVTEQIYCTGTAAPGTLFAYVATAPPGSSATVALSPFRCQTLDPEVFFLNATGQLSVRQPAGWPIPINMTMLPAICKTGEERSILDTATDPANSPYFVCGPDNTWKQTGFQGDGIGVITILCASPSVCLAGVNVEALKALLAK